MSGRAVAARQPTIPEGLAKLTDLLGEAFDSAHAAIAVFGTQWTYKPDDPRHAAAAALEDTAATLYVALALLDPGIADDTAAAEAEMRRLERNGG